MNQLSPHRSSEVSAHARAPKRPILPLALENLVFESGGERLIQGITATIEAGPRTVIMGANGAGKSLLLRLCHGLVPPTGGTVSWNGAAPGAVRPRHALVFQRPVLLRRSAEANVAYGLAVQGIARRERQELVKQVLREAGLAPVAGRPARVLSGGEQQRLALARAWALEPEVLLLDEPTAHLDPAATRAVEEMIERIRATGTKIIMTTHDLGQARRLADEILFLHHGRLVERAAVEPFFAGPESREAHAFLDGTLLW